MVWYVPPLSPVESLVEETIDPGVGTDEVFGAVEDLRIPVEYLASFLSAGDPEPVRRSLRRLAAMRSFMRGWNIRGEGDPALADAVGMTVDEVEDMYRQVAIADYDDRYVLPKAHGEISAGVLLDQGSCGLDFAQPPDMTVPDLNIVQIAGEEGWVDGR
jgi:nitrate reductase / nitrite oxidoreductase, beta subunit